MSTLGAFPAVRGDAASGHEPLLRERARASYARLSEQARGDLVAERLRAARENPALRKLAVEAHASRSEHMQLTETDVKLLASMGFTFAAALIIGGLLLAAAGAVLS